MSQKAFARTDNLKKQEPRSALDSEPTEEAVSGVE